MVLSGLKDGSCASVCICIHARCSETVSLPFGNEKGILVHNDGVNPRVFTK